MFSKIAIVGAGAIGMYYGAKLALVGADVRFLMRSDLATVQARGSLLLHEKSGTTELRPAMAFGLPEEIGPVDLIVVTLKTTANGELARLLPPLLGSSTVIFTLQNGLGSDEQLAELFGAERVMGGLAFIAATRTAPGEVTCYHPGSIALGEFGRRPAGRTRVLAAQFEAAGVIVRVVENLSAARWHKLVWNIPFNGLAIAAGGLTTDRICADPELAAEVRALMAEVQQAAGRLGFVIAGEFLRQQFDVTPPMGAYQPSSLVDFLAGREVEVEAIWGEPLRRAQAAGASVPRLEKLYGELKKLTAQRGA
jgi:2-dehydropantoate 2-reductase